MQKIKTVLAVLLIGFFSFSSCKKSSTNPTSSSVGISFKFNGTSKSATTIVADYIKSQSTLQVSGTIGTGGVSLIIQNPKAGTFDIASGAAIATYASVAADINNTYLATTGSVTITEFNSTTVSGTFQFTGTTESGATGTITEGKFSAKLITQ